MLKDRSELILQIQKRTEQRRELIKELSAAYVEIEELKAKMKELKSKIRKPSTKKTTTSKTT